MDIKNYILPEKTRAKMKKDEKQGGIEYYDLFYNEDYNKGMHHFHVEEAGKWETHPLAKGWVFICRACTFWIAMEFTGIYYDHDLDPPIHNKKRVMEDFRLFVKLNFLGEFFEDCFKDENIKGDRHYLLDSNMLCFLKDTKGIIRWMYYTDKTDRHPKAEATAATHFLKILPLS